MRHAFAATTALAGAVVTAGPWLALIVREPGAGIEGGWPATLILFAPYAWLAARARARPGRLRWWALGALVALGVLFELSARSDAQGALAILLTLPAQWSIAVLAGRR